MKVRISIYVSREEMHKGHVLESIVVDKTENPIIFIRLISVLTSSYIVLVDSI